MIAPDPFTSSIADLRRRTGVKWTEHGDDVIGAFVAEMDFGTAPEITAALHDAVSIGRLNYLAAPLERDLGEACAAWYRRTTGWTPDPERIHPVADVVRALDVAAAVYSRPGSALILPTPAYMPFFELPAEIGRPLITVPMVEDELRYRLDLDGIARAFEQGGGLLILTNPCNPVGRVFTHDELVALAEVVESVGGRVFVDEIHAPLVYEGHRHIPYASVSPVAAAHSVTAVSASKAWNLPGLKCANVILTNEADAARWDAVGSMAKHGASTLGVIANTVAYRDGDAWLTTVIRQLDTNRARLAEALADRLPAVRHRSPEGTYLGWLDTRPLGLGDLPATFFLDAARVALTDGIRCGAPGFVRLNFATPPAVLEEILDRMVGAVAAR